MSDRPYPYVEYPKHLYKPGGEVRVVHTDEEKAEALHDGWQLQPVPSVTNPPAPEEPLELAPSPVTVPQRRWRKPKAE